MSDLDAYNAECTAMELNMLRKIQEANLDQKTDNKKWPRHKKVAIIVKTVRPVLTARLDSVVEKIDKNLMSDRYIPREMLAITNEIKRGIIITHTIRLELEKQYNDRFEDVILQIISTNLPMDMINEQFSKEQKTMHLLCVNQLRTIEQLELKMIDDINDILKVEVIFIGS